MVALKAELSAMIPGVPGVTGPSWDVFVAGGADLLPAGAGSTNLGTFEHHGTSDAVHKHGPNHVAVHHIRDLLYKRVYPTGAAGANPFFPYNFTDLSVLKIKRHGPVMTSTALTAVPVTMLVGATATLAPKLQPGDVASVVADNTFVSRNPAIATVADTGVVTGVAPGTTVVGITNKWNGLYTEAGVTVTTAALLMVDGPGEPEDEPVTTPENTPDNDPDDDPDEEIIDEEEEVSVGEIGGVGPATEAKLADVGITTARQIAELSEEEADKLDDELGLGGRIRRDDWVAQAKDLIA